MIAQRARVVQRVMRHLAVGCGAEAAERHELEGKAGNLGHDPRAGDQQGVELRDVLRPVGDDQRAGITGKIMGDRAGGVGTAHTRRDEAVGDSVEVRCDIALDPFLEMPVPVERQVELLAMFRHERQAEKRSAPAVIFGIEEVSQRCAIASQSSVGSALPLRQRSWAIRTCLPRSSSSLRISRPRFSSASFWLVVTASTPAEAAFTGKVTTSTAVLATVSTTRPLKVRGRAARM